MKAGTSPVYRAALQDSQFAETDITRAFTGRYARGLRNRFIDQHEAQAPFGFPEVGQITGPLCAASVNAGDPHGMTLWAGTGFQRAKAAPVAQLMQPFA